MFSVYNKTTNIFLFGLLFFVGCRKENLDTTLKIPLTPYTISYPNYFPTLNISSDNPLTVEGIFLGRKLYYDPILSNNNLSCSSCHASSKAFTTYDSNALPHINLGWNTTFLWDGKITGTLEDAMMFEVDEFFKTDISKLNNNEEYKKLFKQVYSVDTIKSKQVAYALAQFFRLLSSSNSKFDKYLQKQGNLNTDEMNGFVLFNTEKGDCFHCHTLGLFTDNRFHNIGLDSEFEGEHLGRYNATKNANDIGLMKTPTLRNVELTAPYMHDGRFETLEQVVNHYNSGVKLSATLDPIMTKPSKEFGLELTSKEKKDLVAFLKSLTDTTFTNNPLLQKPN